MTAILEAARHMHTDRPVDVKNKHLSVCLVIGQCVLLEIHCQTIIKNLSTIFGVTAGQTENISCFLDMYVVNHFCDCSWSVWCTNVGITK